MSYPVRCPHCGALLNAEPSWAGQQSTCPNCRQVLTIPPPPVSEVLTGEGPAPQGQYVPRPTEDYSTRAVVAFFVTLLCCGLLGIILAYDADRKMKACGNMNGHGWVVASYIAFVVNVIATIALGLGRGL